MTRCQTHKMDITQCNLCNTGEGDLLYHMEVETLLLPPPMQVAPCMPRRASSPEATKVYDDKNAATTSDSTGYKAVQEAIPHTRPGEYPDVSCAASHSPASPRLWFIASRLGPFSPLDQSLEAKLESMRPLHPVSPIMSKEDRSFDPEDFDFRY